MNNALAALLYPMKTTKFLDLYRKGEPCVVHHGPEELKSLRDLPCLASLEALLKSWPDQVEAHLPDLRDESSAIAVSARDAQKLFDNGMGLLFNDANRFFPVLEEWVHDLRSELGLSQHTYGRSLFYATPNGKGTTVHFDQNINFVLQIYGTKKWKLAKNQSVPHPMVRHTLGQSVDPEMMSYQEAPMPDALPSEQVSFDLQPGSLLFVPRGVWHCTEAQGDALSLNFTFTAPTWADLFLSALRSRLVLSPEWRETADGFYSDEGRVEAEKKLDDLLAGLRQDLPYWRAADILDATES